MTLARTKLTPNERRVLAELAKPVGKRDYHRVHGRTIHALERKGLFGSNGKPGGAVTAAGHAELAVPDIFADLFDNEVRVPQKKKAKKASEKSTEVTEPVEFRPIEFVETTLHDPVRERWDTGAETSGVRLWCTSSPITHGEENGRWSLLIYSRVKISGGRPGKRFAVSSASMSREDLLWLRALVDAALRRKAMTPTWKWNRDRGRYEAALPDGSELRVLFHRRGRSGPRHAGREKAGFWSANVRPVWDQRQHDLGCYGDPFPDADAAKRAAIDWYTQNRPAAKPKRRIS